jgi:hypothetical protein
MEELGANLVLTGYDPMDPADVTLGKDVKLKERGVAAADDALPAAYLKCGNTFTKQRIARRNDGNFGCLAAERGIFHTKCRLETGFENRRLKDVFDQAVLFCIICNGFAFGVEDFSIKRTHSGSRLKKGFSAMRANLIALQTLLQFPLESAYDNFKGEI